jgi:hypothetical protein
MKRHGDGGGDIKGGLKLNRWDAGSIPLSVEAVGLAALVSSAAGVGPGVRDLHGNTHPTAPNRIWPSNDGLR